MGADMKVQALAAVAALLLAGCGGGGGTLGQNPPQDFLTAKTAYEAVEGRLAARSNTAYVPPFIEGMPSSGTATYRGYVFADLQTPSQNTELYGQATITANFAPSGGTMSGTASNFFGKDNSGAEASYAGQLTFSNGVINVDRKNDFDLNYSGTLTGNGDTVVLSGKIDGDFKGDPIRGIYGTDTMTGTVNGTGYPGNLILVAED